MTAYTVRYDPDRHGYWLTPKAGLTVFFPAECEEQWQQWLERVVRIGAPSVARERVCATS